jgi:branched-subunit amino acid transport protein
MNYSGPQIWFIIAVLAVGTFMIRFSFLGIIGNRVMPPLVIALLRYTPVAVLPAMVAPLVIWPAATEGETDPVRLCAAVVTLVVGVATRHTLWAMLGGATTLLTGLLVTGQIG